MIANLFQIEIMNDAYRKEEVVCTFLLLIVNKQRNDNGLKSVKYLSDISRKNIKPN